MCTYKLFRTIIIIFYAIEWIVGRKEMFLLRLQAI